MYYIDGPGATPDHKFTDGDPAAGVAPTTVTDDFMNDVQQEILNVMAAAGIVPAKNTQDQLLQAIRGVGGTGVFTTPPQFDNSKKAATTEWVTRALGSNRGGLLINANTVLTAGEVGKTSELYGTTTFTITLPPTVGLAPQGGAVFRFVNLNAVGVTISCQGADSYPNFAQPKSSIVLLPGDTFEVQGFNGWVITGGSYNLINSNQFRNLKQASGYQAIPNGMILQWTQVNFAAAGQNVPVVLPVSYPTQHTGVIVTNTGSAIYAPGSNAFASGLPTGANTCSVQSNYSNSASAVQVWSWGF